MEGVDWQSRLLHQAMSGLAQESGTGGSSRLSSSLRVHHEACCRLTGENRRARDPILGSAARACAWMLLPFTPEQKGPGFSKVPKVRCDTSDQSESLAKKPTAADCHA